VSNDVILCFSEDTLRLICFDLQIINLSEIIEAVLDTISFIIRKSVNSGKKDGIDDCQFIASKQFLKIL
jgi:hypothetical protein